MASINSNIFSFFHPKIPEKWTFENSKDIQTKLKPIRNLASFLRVIGALGFIVTIYKSCKVLLGIIPLTPNLFLWAITSFFLRKIGQYIHHLANKHTVGLDDNLLTSFAAQKLKDLFEKFPVFATELELKERLITDPQFSLSKIKKNFSNIRSFIPFSFISNLYIELLYRPTKEINPYIRIYSNCLSEQDKLELLISCVKKGIILEFINHENRLASSDSPKMKELETLAIIKNFKKEAVLNSHFFSIKFLKECLKNNINDAEIINQQLKALSFRFINNNRIIAAFKPTIYLENDETIVIRGNCSEIGDPLNTIDLIAETNKKIKIETTGLIYSNSPIHWKCLNDDDLEAIIQHLTTQYPHKKFIVEPYEEEKRQIWQKEKDIKQSIPFGVSFADEIEDFERIKKMNAQHL